MIILQVHRQLYRECNGDYAQVAAMLLPWIDWSGADSHGMNLPVETHHLILSLN